MPKEKNAPENYEAFIKKVREKLNRRTFITTNGNVRGGVFDDKLEKALQILNGEIPDNGMLPCIWQLDADEEVNDKRAWHKANPSLMRSPPFRKV